MTTFPHYLTSLDYLPLKNIFYPAETPSKKLMIILHGRGGTAKDFTWITETLELDDMHYLLLNATNCYDDGYSWYTDNYNHDKSILSACTLLIKTFNILFKKDFDISKSFLFGFSQGALLTFECGARYTHKFAGYISVSGHIVNPKLLLKEINPELKHANWLCTHGTEDEALDFTKAKEDMELLQKSGMHITFKAFHKTHTITQEEMHTIKRWMIKQNT